MHNRNAGLVNGALVLFMLAAGAWTLTRIPPGHVVPIHFGLDGRPNGWAPAGVGLFIPPAVGALMCALMFLLPKITPRGANLDRSGSAYGTIWVASTAVLALGQCLVVASTLGYRVDLRGAVPVIVGVLFIVIGNVLPKLRWNYVVGIRTPWTLADERVWDKTHRFGGWVTVLGGGVLLISAALWPHAPKPGLVAGVIGLTATLMVGKSYLLWREQQRAKAS